MHSWHWCSSSKQQVAWGSDLLGRESMRPSSPVKLVARARALSTLPQMLGAVLRARPRVEVLPEKLSGSWCSESVSQSVSQWAARGDWQGTNYYPIYIYLYIYIIKSQYFSIKCLKTLPFINKLKFISHLFYRKGLLLFLLFLYWK